MEGRHLSKCVFHSGKCLYGLLACACRNSVSIPKVCCLSNVGNGGKFLHGHYELGSRILLVEKIQPLCQQRGTWMSHGDMQSCGPSTVLKLEEKILSMTQYIRKLLCPVTLQTVLKILNPFGHSWNMLEDLDQVEGLDTYDEDHMQLGPIAD